MWFVIIPQLFFIFFSVDATNSIGRVARYINDSKFVNCLIKVVIVENKPHLCIFALVDIDKDIELRYNYGEPGLPWRINVRVLYPYNSFLLYESGYEIPKQNRYLKIFIYLFKRNNCFYVLYFSPHDNR